MPANDSSSTAMSPGHTTDVKHGDVVQSARAVNTTSSVPKNVVVKQENAPAVEPSQEHHSEKTPSTSKSSNPRPLASQARRKKGSGRAWLLRRTGKMLMQELDDDFIDEKDEHEHHVHHESDDDSDINSVNDSFSQISAQSTDNDERHCHTHGTGDEHHRHADKTLPDHVTATPTKMHASRPGGSATPSKKKTQATVTIKETGQGESKSPIELASPGSKASLNAVEILVKIFNLLIPAFFVVLGVLHIKRAGITDEGPNPDPDAPWFPYAVSMITSAAITMWSIVFAAIAGQALKAYATYGAERGIKLMSLEQLLHSQSFSSSIKQPLLLRRIDVTSLCLFALWALSPIANQALQKMSYSAPSGSVSDVNITTLAIGLNKSAPLAPEVSPPSFGGYGSGLEPIPAFLPLYSSALTRPTTKNSTARWDIWGNPLLPLFTNYTGSASMSEDWNSISDQDQHVDYASLVGLPIAVPSDGISEFEVNTDQYLFECLTPSILNASQIDTSMIGVHNWTDIFVGNNSRYANTAKTLFMSQYPTSNKSQSDGRIEWVSVSTDDQLHRGDTSDGPNAPTWIEIDDNTLLIFNNCTYKSIHVANRITCDPAKATPCSVTHVKLIQDDWQGDNVNGTYMYDFVQVNYGTIISLAEAYMADPDQVLQVEAQGADFGGNTYGLIADLSAEVFTARFQKLWNTFMQLSYATKAPYIYYDQNFTDQVPTYNVTGTLILTTTIWKLNPAWLTVYFVAVAVMFGFALADIYWEYNTTSPDFLGFASSLVRSNQRLGRELRGLSGVERTRAMADMKVMLQDISTDGNMGKIALAPVTSGSQRLTKRRVLQKDG